MYVQWKGLNHGTNTIKHGSCEIAIKSNSVTVTGWFMTGLTKAGKEQRGAGKERCCVLRRGSGGQKDRENGSDISAQREKRLPHLLSFRRAIVISLPSVKKDPGTFQLPLIWQMSDNFTFNLSPAGAKCARQRADAAVISEEVESWLSWNWVLTHQNVLIRMSERSWAEAPFPPPSLNRVFSERWTRRRKLYILDSQIQRADTFSCLLLFSCF